MDGKPGYPPVATGYPAHNYYPQTYYAQQQQQQHQGVVPEAPKPGYHNPYIFTQDTSKRGHSPDCNHCERKRKTGIANALAAIFIVCWCCTWPCHGPCCCGF